MPLHPDDPALDAWLRLAATPGVGPQRLQVLLQAAGDPERALRLSRAALAALPGVGPRLAERVQAQNGPAARAAADGWRRTLARLGALVVVPTEPAYPADFRQVDEPPLLLFVCGRLEVLQAPAVALVGTRYPTAYGRQVARAFAQDFARAGVAVVSGMARGIDAAAHTAALEAGGPTIGVLGHGIDRVYPSELAPLFARMRRDGLLLTEFFPGEPPLAAHFPRRNRLIAALARAVVVVEMGQKSGAQHTVEHALRLGRDVFAVPGPVTSPASSGTNQLLKDGAQVATAAADVLVALGEAAPTWEEEPAVAPGAVTAVPDGLPPLARRLLEVLAGAESRHIDELVVEVGRPAPEVLASLLELELEGWVASRPGGRYARPR